MSLWLNKDRLSSDILSNRPNEAKHCQGGTEFSHQAECMAISPHSISRIRCVVVIHKRYIVCVKLMDTKAYRHFHRHKDRRSWVPSYSASAVSRVWALLPELLLRWASPPSGFPDHPRGRARRARECGNLRMTPVTIGSRRILHNTTMTPPTESLESAATHGICAPE